MEEIDVRRGDVSRSREIVRLIAKALATETTEQWDPVLSTKGAVPNLFCRCGFSTDLPELLSTHVAVVHGTRYVERWEVKKSGREAPSGAPSPTSLPRSSLPAGASD